MDVVLGAGINNLTGLHLDLDGVGTGVGLITPLDGVTINGSTSPALIDGNDVRSDSSHVVVDTIATSGWDGGPVVTLKFVNLPDSYTDGSMSPESMVSSLIREEYIQTNSNDGWVTLTSLGYVPMPSSGDGSGDSSDNYPISEWSVADEASLQDMLIVDAVAAGAIRITLNKQLLQVLLLLRPNLEQVIMSIRIDLLVAQLFMKLTAPRKI